MHHASDHRLQCKCHSGGEVSLASCMPMYCVCRVVLQTAGATPLYIASANGHVECVQVLLDRGADINQAAVGRARSIALH